MGRLNELSTSELLALLKSREVDDREALEILRNPYCTPEVATLVAAQRRALSSHKVRELLAGFRGFSFARAMNLIATLPWLSLLQLAKEPRTPPVVRRQAEKKILDKLPHMSLGEKVALARAAHRPLFGALTRSHDEPVLVAMLDNPRVVENDLLVIVNTRDAPDGFYRELARHHRWGRYLGVRRALAACNRTPLPLALSLAVELGTGELAELLRRPGLRSELREAVATLLEKRQRLAGESAKIGR